jgi:hypothetical protein
MTAMPTMWSIGHPDRTRVTNRTSASSQQRCTVAALDHALSVRDGAARRGRSHRSRRFCEGVAAGRYAARASAVTTFPEWNVILAASHAAAGRTSIAVMMIYRSDPDAEKLKSLFSNNFRMAKQQYEDSTARPEGVVPARLRRHAHHTDADPRPKRNKYQAKPLR